MASKRGRPRKSSIAQRAPAMENALLEYNPFQQIIDKQLPRNTLQMYVYRRDAYEAARREGLGHRDAIKRANKLASEHFNCTTQTVRNNIGTIRANGKWSGGALERSAKILEKLQEECLFPRMELCNEDVRRLNRALKLLRDPSYADVRSAFSLPKTDPYQDFRSGEAVRPDSTQRLASALAEAFARAHARADEISGKCRELVRQANTKAAQAEADLKRLRTWLDRNAPGVPYPGNR